MASWTGTFGSSPTWKYTLTATCTNRTSTQATIKMDLKLGLKIQSSSTKFGYNYYWEPIIGSTSGGWQKLKDASPNWSDGVQRTYSYTATVSAAASVTEVVVKFNTKSTQISGSAYSPAVSQKLTIPTGNTAPVWSSNDAHIKLGTEALKSNIVIPENTSTVTVVIPTITDAQKNSIKLTTVRYANNSSQGTVNTATVASGTSHTFTDNISGLGPGTQVKYTTSATDGSLSASGTRTTWVYTKNVFTKATVSNIGSIKHKTGFSFTITNGKNNGGKCNGKCYYTLTSLTSGVSVYGAYTGSTTGTGTHTWNVGIDNDNGGKQASLKFSELKSVLASSNYKGSIKLRLTSNNDYGSSGYVDFTVNVDLTTTLPNVTNIKYSGGTVTVGSTAYYCPQKSNTMSVSFTTVTDPIGVNSITYKVYLNSTYLGNATVSGTTGSYSINLKTYIGNTDKSNNIVDIEAVANYGVKSYTSGSTFRTYSYSDPSIAITSITRTGTTAKVAGTFTLGTDLPVTPNGLTYTITGGSATAYTLSGSGRNRTFSISLSSLAEKAYTITVKASDTYVSKSATGTIPLADPMLSLRTNGVGINCIPDGTATMVVNGSMKLKDIGNSTVVGGSGKPAVNTTSNFNSLWRSGFYEGNGASNAPFSGWNWVIHTGHSSNNSGGAYNYGMQIAGQNGTNNFAIRTTNQAGSGTWNTIYHTNNKPSPADIGAAKAYTTANGYQGITLNDGTTANWIRTTSNGLLPYQSGGASSLGTSSWPFNAIYGKILYENGTALSSKYLSLSGGTLSGQLTGCAPTKTYSTSFTARTSGDNNGRGDGNTHIGYLGSDGKFHHYFRAAGSMNINCNGGTYIDKNLSVEQGIFTGTSLYAGDYNTNWKAFVSRRVTNSQNYDGRYGASYLSSIKLTSSSTAVMAYGATIECYDANKSSAVRRYLFSQNSFVPMSDNNTYLGTASHRWQSAYCTEGKFYTSTRSFKTNIKSVDEPLSNVALLTADSEVKTTKDYIIEAIKDTPMTVYNYRTRMANNARSTDVTENQMFVGFIADDLKANHPEFFSLIGESGIHKRDILDENGEPTGETIEEMQYDISDVSMLGALWTGLQEALLQIDSLKEEVSILKGENIDV